MSKTSTMSGSKVYHEHQKRRPALSSVGYVKRFCAYLLDFYVGMLLCSFPIVIANGMLNQSEKMQMNLFFFEGSTLYIVGVISLLVGFWYYVYIPWKVWKGQTFAKHVLHIKIVKMDGENVDMKALLLRQVIGMFLVEGAVISCTSILRQMLTYMTSINFVDSMIYLGFAISIVSAIMMLFSKNHRMIHDYLGTTTVISTNE